jgi:hypothetical protein
MGISQKLGIEKRVRAYHVLNVEVDEREMFVWSLICCVNNIRFGGLVTFSGTAVPHFLM